jgi:hypothetical protein
MNRAICLSVLLAGAASAAPIVSSQVTDLGGGLYSSVISLSDGSTTGSWAANLTFTGAGGAQINQVAAFGALAVNTETDAGTYQALPGSGYTKSTDTWYYNTVFTTVLPAGVVPGANSFKAHVGTAAGVNWGEVTMLHIVSTQGALSYSGTIGRGGNNYNVSGSFDVPAIPEPASLAAAAAGLLLAGRRRRVA